MSTTVVEFENQDVIVVEMSGRGPMGPRGQQGEPGPAGPSEWGVIQGNISDQTDLQNALDAKVDVGVSYTKSEDDALLAQKADADSVYTKTETDALLADKADTDDVYSKTEVNTLLSGKADADTVYTKTETDTLLDAKVDVGDSYTKAEEDALLAVKANSADVYTKTETDTLLADKADSADVYTKDETDALLLDKAPVILNSASGSIASFSDGSASPVTALSVSIEPVQAGTGDPSPTNIRPISGHTSATVTRTGKSLLEPAMDITTKNGVTFTQNSDGTITTSGAPTANFSGRYPAPISTAKINTLKPGTYRLSGCPSGGGSSTYKLSVWNQSASSQLAVDYGSGVTFTIPETSHSYYVRITIYKDVDVTGFVWKPMITKVEDDTTYEPYQGTSVTIDLDGTRYGGTLNVLTGEMTVTDGNIASYDGETLPSTWISDRDVYAPGTTPTIGAQVVYKLASPQTVFLTPQQINSLLGENHIWADTGDVAVTYRADTKLYIEKLTKPTEDDMIANSNIEANTFFMVGISLYYATSAIATGTTIVPGSNCTALSLAEALNNLNA